MTRPPTPFTQLMDRPLSMKPSISILFILFVARAQSQTDFTDSNSPEDTLAEAISMRGTLSSHNTKRVMFNFSDVENETPDVCSPSRNVVSSISICIVQ